MKKKRLLGVLEEHQNVPFNLYKLTDTSRENDNSVGKNTEYVLMLESDLEKTDQDIDARMVFDVRHDMEKVIKFILQKYPNVVMTE